MTTMVTPFTLYDIQLTDDLPPGSPFEVMRVRHGSCPLLQFHRERLTLSLAARDTKLPMAFECAIDMICEKSRDEGSDLRVRLGVVNGGGIRIAATPLDSFPARAQVCTVPLPSRRHPTRKIWPRPELDQLRADVREQGYDEAIMITAGGEIVEATRFNVALIRHDQVVAADPRGRALFGCGLRWLDSLGVLQLATLTLDDLVEADNVFLINSLRGPCPVEAVDDLTFTPPGKCLQALIDRFHRLLGMS